MPYAIYSTIPVPHRFHTQCDSHHIVYVPVKDNTYRMLTRQIKVSRMCYGAFYGHMINELHNGKDTMKKTL